MATSASIGVNNSKVENRRNTQDLASGSGTTNLELHEKKNELAAATASLDLKGTQHGEVGTQAGLKLPKAEGFTHPEGSTQPAGQWWLVTPWRRTIRAWTRGVVTTWRPVTA